MLLEDFWEGRDHQRLCRMARKERTQKETSLRGFATVQMPMGRPALQLGAMGGERVNGTTLGPGSDCEVSAQGDLWTWLVAKVAQENDKRSLEMC